MAGWADENRTRQTALWYFINVEPGLSFEDFKEQVESKQDVYTAVVKEAEILADEKAGRCAKYVVHFVGNIHQPMHVSRAEYKFIAQR